MASFDVRPTDDGAKARAKGSTAESATSSGSQIDDLVRCEGQIETVEIDTDRVVSDRGHVGGEGDRRPSLLSKQSSLLRLHWQPALWASERPSYVRRGVQGH